RLERDALRLHLAEAPVEDAFFHLELGNAVTKQAADPIVALEDGHVMAGAVELLGGGETGRARADDRHPLARARARRLGLDPAGLERVLDDAPLDGLDRDRGVVDAEDAGAFTRGRAERARELGEVVGGVQALDGLAPPV